VTRQFTELKVDPSYQSNFPFFFFLSFITDRYSRNPGLISHNVCVSSVVRFRSRVLSPTPNVERRYELWITPHCTIEETFCCRLAISSTVTEWSVHILALSCRLVIVCCQPSLFLSLKSVCLKVSMSSRRI
jgi:hypothetical protein